MSCSRSVWFGVPFALFLLVSVPAAGQPAAKETLEGAKNYTRVEQDLACGGVIAFEAFPELKRRGFKAVLNLRRPDEPNANVEAEGAAVRAAGLKYINIPFNAAAPDAAALVELYLKTVSEPSNLPVFIHSTQAHRPAGLLMIKRVLVDGWSVEKASAEADVVALSDGSAGAQAARRFGLEYIETHRR